MCFAINQGDEKGIEGEISDRWEVGRGVRKEVWSETGSLRKCTRFKMMVVGR
jgi:hypothetical protein